MKKIDTAALARLAGGAAETDWCLVGIALEITGSATLQPGTTLTGLALQAIYC